MKIIVNTFSHEFFLRYIPTPSEESLYDIIKKFSNTTKMQNMVKCIDNCHIPLYEKSKKKKVLITWDCYNLNNLHFLSLEITKDSNKLFWNVYFGQPGECTNGDRFKLVKMYHFLWNKLILWNFVDLYGIIFFFRLLGILPILYTHTY